ncbi:MAG: LysR family transcriptional regulator [Fulvimarina manganoxydans]|uniref:LysR substrate-binding domain-containing protein n=1 Tax=Fulvimarina manganoxydans TaxID=937218 RepID=UPI002356480C|nr:LysR substrate-binding domain-containing protein [Fulvimarina manganoxydans]MCK5931308.1 LysR family transcriptional regulator [Fulvimarina manganoxydans]
MSAIAPIRPLLDLDLARTFVAICETGNFSRAAERVHRSASAISLQVKKLEEMLGRELFERETRKITITRDGELLLGYARRLLRLNDEAMAHFLVPDLAGSVRLGIPNDNGIVAMPDILRRFADSHAHVDVDVYLTTTSVLRERVRRGELDLAIFSYDPKEDNGKTPADIIHREPLVWVGARHGSAVEKRPLPVALAEPGCYWRADAIEALEGAELAYRIAYTSEFCQGQIAAVSADLAIAPLPASVVSDKLVRLGPDHGLPELPDYQMTLALRDGASPATKALGEHVVASFRAISQRGMRIFA